MNIYPIRIAKESDSKGTVSYVPSSIDTYIDTRTQTYDCLQKRYLRLQRVANQLVKFQWELEGFEQCSNLDAKLLCFEIKLLASMHRIEYSTNTGQRTTR